MVGERGECSGDAYADQLKTTAGSGGADMCGFRRIVGRRGTFYQNDLGDATSGAVKGMVYDPDSSWKAVR